VTRMVSRWYHFGKAMHQLGIPVLPKCIRLLTRIVFSCDIPYTCDIDKTTEFSHNALGVVIHRSASIGAGTIIFPNVTIGGNGKAEELNGPPRIGKNVFIGAGAVILGPVEIGDHAVIGSNAVVLQSVPAGGVAVGVPARVIKIKKLH